MLQAFEAARVPQLIFGAGEIRRLPALARTLGSKVLLVTGARSAQRSEAWSRVIAGLNREGVGHAHISIKGEPTPEQVDDAVAEFSGQDIQVVVGWGGGAAVDAGKAIAGMLPQVGSVFRYLEGVGEGGPYQGPSLPYIAVPTTAGTGSEATKNAVLSRVGEVGFKNSIRGQALVPRVALLDPELHITVPGRVTATCGMDAVTQLLEGYLSTGASPFTDALALSGLAMAADALVPVSTDRGGDVELRGRMAYASYLSGIVLANAGLGVVHGLAGPLGGRLPVPHGVACGTLLAPSVAITLDSIDGDDPHHGSVLRRYARVGLMLGGPADTAEAARYLVDLLEGWAQELEIPGLGEYGLGEELVPELAAAGDNKSHPVQLTVGQREELLRSRL